MCRSLAQKEGMLVGGSAGLNLHAAVEISKTAKPGSVIVAILADNGVKYLTKIYNNDWIKAKVCVFLQQTTGLSHALCSLVGFCFGAESAPAASTPITSTMHEEMECMQSLVWACQCMSNACSFVALRQQCIHSTC